MPKDPTPTGSGDNWTPPPKPTQPPHLSWDGPSPPKPPQLSVPQSLPPDEGPLDVKRYTQVLEAPDIPTFEATMDHTAGITGFGPGAPSDHRDLLNELSEGDQVRLLQANNVRPVPTTGAAGETRWEMAAFVVGNDLEPAPRRAVRFRQLSMLTPEKHSIDHAGYSYREFESNLQKHMVSTSELEFGIPSIFKVSSSYSQSSATAAYEKTVKIHSEASQLIPKARIVINDDQITLDPDFVKKINSISGTKREKTDKLLDLLKEYGHFVALQMMVGGRLTFYSSTELSDKADFETVKREFKAAADARFTIEGVPVEAGGGTGVGTGQTGTVKTVAQAKSLHMELQGGDENLASSKDGQLGRAWVASLGRYREWRVVGFYTNSLVPIIDFLPEEKSRQECRELLRDYFVSKLSIQESASAGDRHGKDLAKDGHAPDPHVVKRISEIELKHGGCLDRLKITYEVYDGASTKMVATGWSGSDTGTLAHIKLKRGENITAIQAWVDPTRDGGLAQRVAFITSAGIRYPNSDGFYGRNKGSKDVLKTIEAPRVRGIVGSNGAYIHRLGLSYAALDADAKSREYLLAMEPYLFPDGDYGVVS